MCLMANINIMLNGSLKMGERSLYHRRVLIMDATGFLILSPNMVLQL
jgi:hypothetical protein